ncbi:MAG TPA: oligopeptide:H+ symporter [Caulobacteraceae bacterium]
MFNVVFVVGVFVTVLTGIPVALQMRGHPRGLFVLFFAEMWERFSYYGMRALLIFYLTEHFLFSDTFSQGQYAAYTTMIYLMPLWGGFLADRYLGARKAVAFGALLLVAGHLTMAVEGKPAVQTLAYGGHTYLFQAEGRTGTRQVCLKVDGGCYKVMASKEGGMAIGGLPASASLPATLAKGAYRIDVQKRDQRSVDIFYLALALIIMGVGYMKANISTIVGQLYPQGDPRRDPGFTLYYYGINLGAFWAAVLCGLVGQTIGWWAGFGLAGLGMLAGFLVFIWGKPLLDGHGEPPDPVALKRKLLGPIDLETGLYLAGLVGVVLVWWLVRQFALMGWSLLAAWGAVLGYLAWYMTVKCDKVARERLLLALVLIFASIVFFILFNQAGSSLNQFAERNTALPHNGFWTMTPGQTQSFNAGFILIFAPVFAFAWTKLAQVRRDPNPVIKFGLGLVQVGLGFLILVWGSQFHDAAFRVPVIFLALAYLMHTTGELCLSPVGMSEMTKLSPTALVSTLMALWFMSLSAGEFLGGLVARLTASDTVAGQVLDPGKALGIYVETFRNIGLAGIGVGVLLLIVSPWLKTLAHGVNDAANHAAL